MQKATLRILATTDLHAHVFGWDYNADLPRSGIGMSDLAQMIDAARRDCPNTVLVDNGDFLQGSALGDWAAEAGPDAPHPVISAMNVMGYDAATLGNHEFSHGLPVLQRAIAEADFPIISANLAFTGNDHQIAKSTVLARVITVRDGTEHPLAIGITGIAPALTTTWEAAQIDGRVDTLPTVPAIRTAVAELRKAGADLVILLAHAAWHGAQDQGEDLHALEQLEVDAVILGHLHGVFPPPEGSTGGRCEMPALLAGKPAVMAGFFGSHLGQIDLTLGWTERGWHVCEARSEAILSRPAQVAHQGIESVCRPAHEATRQWLDERIGVSSIHLQSYFARIHPSNIIRLIAAAQASHVREGLRGTGLGDLPLLSAAAPFRAGGRGGSTNFTDIPAGALQLRHLAEIYPFPNSVVALAVTGAELEDWLERAVIQFATLEPGREGDALLREDSPSFDFDLIDDLAFRIDLTQPPRFDALGRQIGQGRRIRELTFRGQPIARENRFILATNSFRASGSGGFAGCRPERIVLDRRIPARTVVADYLAAGFGADPGRGFRWTYAPVGTGVIIETSVNSAPYLTDIAALRPQAVAGARPGFQRFHLWL